jgi:quercetin dioxygenase-like cupin family protein
VRILDLAELPHRPIEAHDSRGFYVGAFGISADAHLVSVSLRPGGVIGRHPAAARQLLVVLSGDATVSGSDEVAQELSPG